MYFFIKECSLCLEVASLVKEEIIEVEYFNISEMLNKKIYTSEEFHKLCNIYYI